MKWIFILLILSCEEYISEDVANIKSYYCKPLPLNRARCLCERIGKPGYTFTENCVNVSDRIVKEK